MFLFKIVQKNLQVRKQAGIILKLNVLFSETKEDDYKLKNSHKAKGVLFECYYTSVHCTVSVQIILGDSVFFSYEIKLNQLS